MEARAALPVGLPHPKPTISYWQDPPSPIANTGSNEALPEAADVVIVGSGITGASVAWGLLKEEEGYGDGGKRVVMVEARGVCSGATGRNGGHTKAASYRSFPDNVKLLGLEEAKKIARLELANIRATHAFAKEHGIDCESRSCETVDIIYDDAQWRQAQAAVKLIRESFTEAGDSEGVARYMLWDAEEAREKFLVGSEGMRGESVKGAVSYEAGSISAYKFVCGVLKLCLERGLELYTHTPVLKLEKSGEEWDVFTSKGTIKAKQVVCATNGYTTHLLPQFQGKIVPLRGQVTAHRPGSSMPSSGLPTTYSFIYANGYEYVIPRPPSSPFPGDIIIGGGLARAEKEGLFEYGVTDDSGLNEEILAYLADTTKTYFGGNWGEDSEEGRVRREWTGVMGYTPDGLPFVGRVPGLQGLWIAAAFQGHGMVYCWECGRALVGLMQGSEVDWFPKAFGVNEERFGRVFGGRLHTGVAEGE